MAVPALPGFVSQVAYFGLLAICLLPYLLQYLVKLVADISVDIVGLQLELPAAVAVFNSIYNAIIQCSIILGS